MSDNERRIDYQAREDGIIALTFKAMDKQAADEFEVIAKAASENPRSKMRTLYDMRASDTPSRYFVAMQAKLYEGFPYPDDTKTAYVITSGDNAIWLRILRNQYRAKDKYAIFYNFDDAVAWLLE